MLIGFIVVIVMILVIVGLMATGNSGGGTGVNQTKATKVVTEIGTLAQSLAFYKTTTNTGDYTGFNQASAISLLSGYASNGTATVDNDGDPSTAAASETNCIVSQAVPTVMYYFSTNSTSDKLNIDVGLTGSDSALNTALGTTIVSKLTGGNSVVTAEQNTTGTWAAGDNALVVVK